MRRALALALALLASPLAARETEAPDPRIETAGLCDRAAAQAAAESGVPLDVLRAITRTETGRRLAGGFHPWPWTMNIEGKGIWFAGREEAVAHAEATLAGGVRSFDMGCFQVNYRWHGQHFPDLAAMMDPLESARYAARFLATLHAEAGDWEAAAGYYHSRTPQYYTRYRERFARLRADLPPMAGDPLTAPLPARPAAPVPALPAPVVLVALPRTPGAVTLSFRAAATEGLLRQARPLFN